MADSTKLLLFGGAAAAAAWWFYVRVPTGVPSTGAWDGYQQGTGTRMSPGVGDGWRDANNNLVARFDGKAWIPASGLVNTPGALVVPTGPVVPVVPVNQFPIQGANTVSAIQARVILAAAAPPEGIPIDGWGYYLNDALAPLGKSAPDPMPLFSAASPGFDRSQKVTAAQYWPVMGAALRSQLGLSGLGMWRAR